MNAWWVFFAIGVTTLFFRSFFIVSNGAASSDRFDTLRRFVPVAALTALIVPSLVPHSSEAGFSRVLAAGLAALVAWRTKNVLATVAIGLVAFWLSSTVR